MQRSDITRLAGTVAHPAVTVLMPLEQRRPGNRADALRLRGLVAEAVETVEAREGPQTAETLRRRLEEARSQVDFDHPGAGLVVLATPDHASWYTLPFPVRERVVVNERFATRDLLADFARQQRYRVLVLSRQRARLFDGLGTRLTEVTRGDFPLEVAAHDEADAPHKDLPIHDQRATAYRFAYRAVDRALTDLTRERPLPLVLVGVERDLAYFEEVADPALRVAGRVTGNHVDDTPEELGSLVRHVVDGIIMKRQVAALAFLDAAVGAKRAARGAEEVCDSAREGRGFLLLVEEDGDLDQHVDEAVELVLRDGGEVVFVPSESLADHGGAALVLRY